MITREDVLGGRHPVQNLGDIAEFLDNLRQPVTESERRAGPFPYFGANGQLGTIDDFIFDEPLILLAEDGGYFDEPERGIAYHITGKTWVNNHAHVLRTNGKVDRKYLCEVLRHYDVRPFVSGTTRGKLTKSAASRIPIPLPPLSEQRRIAAILDRAESLERSRRGTINRHDAAKRSLFIEMFGVPRTNDKSFATVVISDLVKETRGGANLEPDDFVDSGFPVLHKGAIKQAGLIEVDSKKRTFATFEYADANRRCVVDRRYTVVTLRDLVPTGPTIGLATDLRNGSHPEYLLAQGVYGFVLDQTKIDPAYFVWLSNMATFRSELRRYWVGSTQIHIRKPVYLDIKIPLPPIELQGRFARDIAVLDDIGALNRKSLNRFEVLISSLRRRAFRGEL